MTANLVFASLGLLLLSAVQLDAQTKRSNGQKRIDEFVDVRCGGDVVKALVGKKPRNDRVVVIEGAHRDIGLKDLGGTEVNDSLFQIMWEICGREYMLLEHERITDALLFPAHSRRQPQFIGICLRGKVSISDVQAVLDNPTPRAPGQPVFRPEDTTSLKAIAAWRIDEKARRFVPLDTTGLRCPRGGIISADGGM